MSPVLHRARAFPSENIFCEVLGLWGEGGAGEENSVD